MDFRTEYSSISSNIQIHHKSNILCIGSCFAEVMGTRLAAHKFPVTINPYGIAYNPLSLFNLLLPEPAFSLQQYLARNNEWFHYGTHSSIHANSKALLAEKLKIIHKTYLAKIAQSEFIVITLGSAMAYSLMDGQIVSNCHKMPSTLFCKRLLTLDEIIESFNALYLQLTNINSSLQYILTVSPVRHLKDSIIMDSVSKATLRLACHAISSKFNNVLYFPAYEIVMDDLRDYRFYKEDMIHPSTFAEDYIWQKFSETFFSPETQNLNFQLQEIAKSIAHKPFQPHTEEHIQFLKKTIVKIKLLSSQLDVKNELLEMEQRLIEACKNSNK